MDSSSRNDDVYREAQKALHGLESSFDALFSFLERNGVSVASVQELRRRQMESSDYVNIVEVAQKYLECLCNSSLSSQKASNHVQIDIMVQLIVIAWECVCRYLAILYKDAYRNFHRLRNDRRSSDKQIQNALDRQIQLGEQCTSGMRGLILVHDWERRLTETVR